MVAGLLFQEKLESTPNKDKWLGILIPRRGASFSAILEWWMSLAAGNGARGCWAWDHHGPLYQHLERSRWEKKK
jgi:hypothetical protein